MIHTKCRSIFYHLTNIRRVQITDEQVPWSVPLTPYQPPDYESPHLKGKPWADPPFDTLDFEPKWHQLDDNEINNKIDRRTHTEIKYQIGIGISTIKGGKEEENSPGKPRPLNPIGRTGLRGRGVLGRWGPNHAADPIVTRWKRDNSVATRTLQFCAIERRDCGQWAIPGGMVDAGEIISETLKREFLEEACDSLGANKDEVALQRSQIEDFFNSAGTEVYRGYVDDPRNTDNAWMETVAVNFHDESGTIVGKLQLKAGDDAANVKWIDIDSKLNLYASHTSFLEKVARLHNANW